MITKRKYNDRDYNKVIKFLQIIIKKRTPD